MKTILYVAVLLFPFHVGAQQACTSVTGNLVPSCGLDSVTQVADWSTFQSSSMSFDQGQGVFGAGAGRVVSGPVNSSITRSACFDIEPDVAVTDQYGIGVWMRSLTETDITCSVCLVGLADQSCQGGAGPCTDSFVPSQEFQLYSASFDGILFTGRVSARLSVSCNAAVPFMLHIDDGYVVIEPIFADEFES